MIKRRQQSKIEPDRADNLSAAGKKYKALLWYLIRCVSLDKCNLSIKLGGAKGGMKGKLGILIFLMCETGGRLTHKMLCVLCIFLSRSMSDLKTH